MNYRLKNILNKINDIGLYLYLKDYVRHNQKSMGLIKLFKNDILLNLLKKDQFYRPDKSIAENLYNILNQTIYNNKCAIEGCNNLTEFINLKKGYKKYCSKRCQNKNPILRAKISESQKRYQQNLSEQDKQKRLNKTIETNLKKYGVEFPIQSSQIKEKIKNTLIQKYGVDHIFKLSDIRNKSINSYVESKKREILNDLNEINYQLIDYSDKLNLKIKCDNNHIFKISRKFLKYRLNYLNNKPCPICNPINSNPEKFVIDLIKDNYNGSIFLNTRSVLDNMELDIYLPELNMAIEINGCFYHSELFKDRLYHLRKTIECENKKIRLIHIWEDQIKNKPEIVKSKLLNILNKSEKIYARKCEIKEISSKDANQFLEQNHIQGKINSKYRIGLFYNDELVSLMTFGPLRRALGQLATEGHYELLRFCNKLNTVVVGGASRLFNYFINKYKPKYIVSYAMRDWSIGRLYDKLKFKFVKYTEPGYYWIKNNFRYHRFSFRKSKLIKMGYDSNLTESEIMYNLGYYKIWDSGNIKYEWYMN